MLLFPFSIGRGVYFMGDKQELEDVKYSKEKKI